MRTIVSGILVLLLAGCATTTKVTVETQEPAPVVQQAPWWRGEACEGQTGTWARFGCYSMAVIGGVGSAYHGVDWYSMPTPK